MGMTSKEYHEGYQQGFKDAKADYENRLKADLKAILVELQLEIEEVPKYCMTHDATCVYRKSEEYITDINNVIQQKINSLKEAQNDRS